MSGKNNGRAWLVTDVQSHSLEAQGTVDLTLLPSP